MKLIPLLFFPFLIAAAVPTVELDGVTLGKQERIKDVQIYFGEKDDVRLYQAFYNTNFSGDMKKALEFVVNFPNRCNNSYRKERKFLEKDFNCPIHNENLIETQIVRELKKTQQTPGMIDQFVLKRRIWNKGLHTYNDLVTVKKLTPKEGESEAVEVSYRLLTDEESKSFIDNPVPFDNAFFYTVGTYRLAQSKDGKVDVQYSYATKTDHWFLTSGMVQGSIHSSIATGVRLAVDSIQTVLKD